jgi:hypothetical protein
LAPAGGFNLPCRRWLNRRKKSISTPRQRLDEARGFGIVGERVT